MIPSLIIAVMAVFGVGVASNGAQPGDALYPLKVNVTEKFEASMHPTASGKAAFLASLMDERLNEAAHVASTSPQAQAQFNAAYAANIKAVDAEILALKAKGDFQNAAVLSLRTAGKLGLLDAKLTGSADADLKTKIEADESAFKSQSVTLEEKASEQAASSAGSTTTGTGKFKVTVSGQDEEGEDDAAPRGTLRTRDSQEESGGIKEIEDGGAQVKIGI